MYRLRRRKPTTSQNTNKTTPHAFTHPHNLLDYCFLSNEITCTFASFSVSSASRWFNSSLSSLVLLGEGCTQHGVLAVSFVLMLPSPHQTSHPMAVRHLSS